MSGEFENEFKKVTREELAALLSSHALWVQSGGAKGCRADLSGLDLSEAELPDAFGEAQTLKGAVLDRANLRGTKMEEINLRGASLRGAVLRGAHLKGANLFGANLENADLRHADLRETKLYAATCNRATRCRGVRLDGCHGSPSLKRFMEDQDFLEELRGSSKKGRLAYWAWLVIADCGRSIWPWALWSVLLVIGFAFSYFELGPESFRLPLGDRNLPTGLPWSFSACLYYSVVTFSTLGFGDITPRVDLAAYLVMSEVIIGYVMLGGLISILANKIARRS